MAKYFLAYWRYKTFIESFDEANAYLDHSASEQFKRVAIGDEIWFVTQPPKSGKLILFGKLVVSWLGNQNDTAERLGTLPEYLWESNFHVIAQQPYEPQKYIDITHLVSSIEVISSAGHNRIPIHEGQINVAALQAMRSISEASAKILSGIWYKDAIANDVLTINSTVPNTQYLEGERKLVLHYQRERNQSLVTAAKEHFKNRHGHLFCEVCGFDYQAFYGEIGEDFIEAHHLKPLSQLTEYETTTHIHDLAMVCANCHRMLHRREPWLTVQELKLQLNR